MALKISVQVTPSVSASRSARYSIICSLKFSFSCWVGVSFLSPLELFFLHRSSSSWSMTVIATSMVVPYFTSPSVKRALMSSKRWALVMRIFFSSIIYILSGFQDCPCPLIILYHTIWYLSRGFSNFFQELLPFTCLPSQPPLQCNTLWKVCQALFI